MLVENWKIGMLNCVPSDTNKGALFLQNLKLRCFCKNISPPFCISSFSECSWNYLGQDSVCIFKTVVVRLFVTLLQHRNHMLRFYFYVSICGCFVLYINNNNNKNKHLFVAAMNNCGNIWYVRYMAVTAI